MKTDAMDAFHAHLDVCVRCRTQPFNLCGAGLPLFKAAGEEASKNLLPACAAAIRNHKEPK